MWVIYTQSMRGSQARHTGVMGVLMELILSTLGNQEDVWIAADAAELRPGNFPMPA